MDGQLQKSMSNPQSTSAETKPISFPRTEASVLLDLVRGAAAFIVLIEHWRNLLFVPWIEVTGKKLLWAPFYVVTGAGHQAVVLFFLLSGFLVSSTILRARSENRWSWKSYAEHRLVRLWIVLLPSIMLGALIDSIGTRIPRAAPLYLGSHGSGMLEDAGRHLGLWTAVGNSMFLQTIFVPTLGSNGALWSLANEFWYYALFPLGLIALLGPARGAKRVICGILFIAIAAMVGREILLAFPIWLLGASLNLISTRFLNRKWLLLILPVFLTLLFGRTHFGLLRDYALAVVGFLLIGILLTFRNAAEAGVITNLSRRSARFSYTLYLVHTPFLVLITGMWLSTSQWQPTAMHMILALGVLIGALVYAWCIACLTEFHTDSVRKRISKLLSSRPRGWSSQQPRPDEAS